MHRARRGLSSEKRAGSRDQIKLVADVIICRRLIDSEWKPLTGIISSSSILYRLLIKWNCFSNKLLAFVKRICEREKNWARNNISCRCNLMRIPVFLLSENTQGCACSCNSWNKRCIRSCKDLLLWDTSRAYGRTRHRPCSASSGLVPICNRDRSRRINRSIVQIRRSMSTMACASSTLVTENRSRRARRLLFYRYRSIARSPAFIAPEISRMRS